MKKHLVITLLIAFIALMPRVNASFGDLRYEVTDLNISGNKITFKGWAFIHRTNNYITVYKNTGNNIFDTNSVIKGNGGQSIYIKAYANGIEIATAYNNSKRTKVNYNFYQMQHYRRNGFGNTEKEYRKDYNNASHNTCSKSNETSDCYYQDIDFEISFNVESWKNNYPGQDIVFKIFVTNNDYKNSAGANAEVSTELAADISTIKGNIENDSMKINSGSLSKSVKAIVEAGVPKKINDFRNPLDSWQRELYTGRIYQLCNTARVYSAYTNYFGRNANQLCIQVDYGTGESYSRKEGTFTRYNNGNRSAGVWSSWVVPTGQLSIKVKEDKKCPVVNPKQNSPTCNGSGKFKSDCNELTVGSSTVKINQEGIISSILTPLEVYEGGPFHLGIMYYNTIKWSCVSGPCGNDVTTAMQAKIKNITDFKNNMNLNNVTFNGKSIDRGLFIKECKEIGEFTNNNTLTTVCTFFLPKSRMVPYTGEVKYGEGTDEGINNKYYTDIGFSGNYPISLSILGMSRVKDDSAITDSKEKDLLNPWTGNWTSTIEDCNITVYSRIYKKPTGDGGNSKDSEESGSNLLKYKFIYRPIDINNPFPNRYAGINWFEWYHGSASNRERIRNSYDNSNLEYTIKLDSEKIKNIQDYNKDRNYLDWDGIDEDGMSSFVQTYMGGS